MKNFILSIVLLLLIPAAMPVPASAESGKLNVKMSVSAAVVKAGQTVDVKISLQNYNDKSIPNIGGIQIDVPVDTKYFEYVDKSGKTLLITEEGDFISAAYIPSKKQYTFMYAYMNAEETPLSKTNSDIFSFQVKLKKNIPSGQIFELTCTSIIAGADSLSTPIDTKVEFVQISSSAEVISQNNKDRAAADSNGTPATAADTDKSTEKTNPKDKNELFSAASGETLNREFIEVSITPNDNTPWDKVIIGNTDDKNITTAQTDEGLIILGDDLSYTTAKIIKGDKESAVDIGKLEINKNSADENSKTPTSNEPPARGLGGASRAKNEILIKEEDGEVKAFIDSNGDGAFDTVISANPYVDLPKSKLPLIFGIASPVGLIALTAAWWQWSRKKKSKKKEE